MNINSSKEADVPEEIEKIINAKEEKDYPQLQDFANKNDIVLLAFIGSYVPRRYNPSTSAMAAMNIQDEFGIEKILDELEQKLSNSKEKKAYLLVNSTGGNMSSAYKTARAIRDFFIDITVFIPHYALSGGTLLALTGNRIRMGMMSQLSPLDVQVFYQDQTVSVNSLFKAKDRLDKKFQTQRPEELPYTYQHLVSTLDPVILEEWGGIQNEGKHYLTEILIKSGYSQEEVERLADALVFKFPTHGYVIHYDYASELGLKVEKHDEDKAAWNTMRFWLSRYITQQTDRHFIRYIVPNNKKG